MSYSYIKSVFPNFETSKVYGDNVYNVIRENEKKTEEKKEENFEIPKSYMEEKYISPFNVNNSNHTNINNIKKEELEKTTLSKDNNLKFYNLPLNGDNNDHKTIENFQTNNDSDDHNKYIIHVLECPRCRDAISKQLEIIDDKLKLEGYMELASYIIFGVFILLLIDTLNKK